MGSYATTLALVGGTFAVVDCLAESIRGDALHRSLTEHVCIAWSWCHAHQYCAHNTQAFLHIWLCARIVGFGLMTGKGYLYRALCNDCYIGSMKQPEGWEGTSVLTCMLGGACDHMAYIQACMA